MTESLKPVMVLISTNGVKTECHLCGRSHSRSFILQNKEGEHFKYGSGCVQKVGIDKVEMMRALSKASVALSRLVFEFAKEFEVKQNAESD